jgi:alpha-galactosidase
MVKGISLRAFSLLFVTTATTCVAAGQADNTVWLSSLDLSKIQQGWGRAQVDKAVTGKPLSIGGRRFERGVGTHAKGTAWIELDGGAERFAAFVGVDDAAVAPGSVTFKVVADGKKLWESGAMKPGEAAKPVDLDVKGVKVLLLQVGDAGDGTDNDHADWADARFTGVTTRPKMIDAPDSQAVILTPKPGARPRINGPAIYGCRPGHPFLFRIPVTGERPVTFAAEGLPGSLVLDSKTGFIMGTAPDRGEYKVTLRAKNGNGETSRAFRIVSGDTLALTPPMGWNHWYAHYNRVTDEMMRQAADAMVDSGMADVGYQYVNIDDCWMNASKQSDPLRVGPLRDSEGNIVANRHFPDMKALADYIHSKGLKAGLYTSPGPRTCAGFAGAYQHEAQDARQFAAWGFDFLKYDWCSYGEVAGKDPDLAAMKKPYQLMGDILKQQDRDIVFNLCQYGMGKVWEWGAEVGGHCWRTAGDLGFELDRVFEVALANAEHRQWSRPGAWNDPDYIQIGYIGDARVGGEPQLCSLLPNEQYAFMSLWCLMAAPLFYSGDMSRLDAFTLNVLCNPEVIEVDQDPLGQSARVITQTEDTFLMVKDLEDGSKALGLFNRSEFPLQVTATWSAVGISGTHAVRDLWRQKDLGTQKSEVSARVPRRGVVMLRLGPAKD